MAIFLELKENCFSVRVLKRRRLLLGSFMAPRFIVACSRYLYHRLTRTHLTRGQVKVGPIGVGEPGQEDQEEKYLGSIEVSHEGENQAFSSFFGSAFLLFFTSARFLLFSFKRYKQPFNILGKIFTKKRIHRRDQKCIFLQLQRSYSEGWGRKIRKTASPKVMRVFFWGGGGLRGLERLKTSLSMAPKFEYSTLHFRQSHISAIPPPPTVLK